MDAPKRKKDAQATVQKMGISLLVLGAIVVAIGLAAFQQGSNLRDALLIAFGVVLFLAGFTTWRGAKN